MQVLKDLVSIDAEAPPDAEGSETIDDLKYIRHRLQCIFTAFELLSGQGEKAVAVGKKLLAHATSVYLSTLCDLTFQF
jgi:hypothetical protein